MKIPAWTIPIALAAGLLMGGGLGLAIGLTADAQGNESFETICYAVGGDTYGSGRDVCSDETGQILMIDEGARP